MGKKRARIACHVERHPKAWDGGKAPSKNVRATRCNAPGWVYLIEAVGTGTVKIGYSAQYPGKRMSSLQTANPHDLRLIGFVTGTRRDEQRCHAYFNHLHIRGEWFYATYEIREYFGEMVG
jgi:hypothetical protein